MSAYSPTVAEKRTSQSAARLRRLTACQKGELKNIPLKPNW